MSSLKVMVRSERPMRLGKVSGIPVTDEGGRTLAQLRTGTLRVASEHEDVL